MERLRLIKIVCFFGVKLTLSSQETVKDIFTILGSVILQARVFQTKKTRALYHACGLRYFDMKIHTFLKNRIYFVRLL
jgi:hypothetical protein